MSGSALRLTHIARYDFDAFLNNSEIFSHIMSFESLENYDSYFLYSVTRIFLEPLGLLWD